MSNLTTLPKGDSAWLLRKSIQRIIQQVSVLETNIGSSTTGNSSNTQIIFNDAGTLRGDSGLTYNKTTDVLSVGAATITGDLTVKTNVLKVDTTNNRVGIQITSPTAPLEVGETSGTALRLRRLTSGNTIDVNFYNTNTTVGDVAGIRCDGDGLANTFGAISFWTTQTPNSLVERYRISSVGVHTWQNVGGVAGTAMTLNSTGLGVGVTPNRNLDIRQDQSAATIARIQNQSVNAAAYSQVNLSASGNNWGILVGSSAANSNRLEFVVDPSGTNLSVMRLDTSGNVGIGVTPSGTIYSSSETRFVVKGTATSYAGTVAVQSKGTTNAVTGFLTAGDGVNEVAIGSVTNSPINFYTNNAYKASLDASGNLLVGKSVSLFSTVGVEASGTGFISATNSASTNATTNLSVYSTGAAAFRFYVGLGGTVYATNTTISAISDARLKENVQDIDVGLGAILALKPRKFDWKAGKGKDIKGDRGFIAQEFEQVFPQLVDEWKDEAPEGEAPYKSVRQDLIPVLVKAIQELTARVQTLETR